MKWNSLQHNGPVFPPEYIYKGFTIYVKGNPIILDKDAEEVATFWAQKHATEYINDKVAQKNYWNDFKTYIPSNLHNTKFPDDWDFSNIIAYIEEQKIAKKQLSKQEKNKIKVEKEELKEKYGFAILDGKRVPLGNYVIEPPGLFMGRGKHPNRFKIKQRIYPEDVIINHSSDIPAPAPPAGHSWKAVIENKNALLVAQWVEPNTKIPKKILFGNTSTVKERADKKKFNKVAKLAKNIDYVKLKIDSKLNSENHKEREVATAAKIIAELAIRVGNKKNLKLSADTVGAATLRVEHITIDNNDTITLQFLGKDSMIYKQTVCIGKQTVDNIKMLISNKHKHDNIFSINPGEINKFFKSILNGISAKDFRTVYGSLLLSKALRSKDISKMNIIQKLKFYTDANLAVAKKLNHQSTVSKKYNEQVGNIKKQYTEKKNELFERKKESAETKQQLKLERDTKIQKAKTNQQIKKIKDLYKKKIIAIDNKIARLETQLESLKLKMSLKTDTKGIALGTSKANYSDPRISYSFAKLNNIPINKIYNKSLQEMFKWAEDIDENFYLNYPNI